MPLPRNRQTRALATEKRAVPARRQTETSTAVQVLWGKNGQHRRQQAHDSAGSGARDQNSTAAAVASEHSARLNKRRDDLVCEEAHRGNTVDARRESNAREILECKRVRVGRARVVDAHRNGADDNAVVGPINNLSGHHSAKTRRISVDDADGRHVDVGSHGKVHACPLRDPR